ESLPAASAAPPSDPRVSPWVKSPSSDVQPAPRTAKPPTKTKRLFHARRMGPPARDDTGAHTGLRETHARTPRTSAKRDIARARSAAPTFEGPRKEAVGPAGL